LPAAARLSAFAARSAAGGVDAASAPSGRRVAALLRSRRPLGCRPRRSHTRPASKRGHAGGRPFVTGRCRFAAQRAWGAGQIDSGRLSCGTESHPFGVCRPRRAVRGCRPPGPSRSGVCCSPRHPSRGRVAHAVFVPRASRVKVRCLVRAFRRAETILRRRPRGSFVAGVLQTAHVPGPRRGCSRGLAGTAFASPAAPVGFAATLRSVIPTPRVSAPRRRLGPTCRFARH
jgi:hypothetical protein